MLIAAVLPARACLSRGRLSRCSRQLRNSAETESRASPSSRVRDDPSNSRMHLWMLFQELRGVDGSTSNTSSQLWSSPPTVARVRGVASHIHLTEQWRADPSRLLADFRPGWHDLGEVERHCDGSMSAYTRARSAPESNLSTPVRQWCEHISRHVVSCARCCIRGRGVQRQSD